MRGGIANLAEAMAIAMKKENIDVEIVSFSLQYPSFLFPGKTQKDQSSPPKGIIIYTKLNSINPINWIITTRFILKKKPDTVIIRYWLPFMAPCLGTVARMINYISPQTKIIGVTDNVIPHEKRFGDRLLTSFFIKGCDGFLAMSKSVLNDILGFTKSKPSVFSPHPLYDTFGEQVSKVEARKKLEISTSENVVLFFGIIRKYKGLSLLLDAAKILKERKLNILFLIAGEFYEDKKEYSDLIKKNEIETNVKLVDFYIPFNEVKYYFCASDIVAQPYLNATQSGVTQIAYHFDKPMLVTNVGGLPETVSHMVSGYVCKKNSIEIADSLEDFFINQRESEFKQGVIKEKEKFQWSYFIDKLRELNNLINK